MNVLVTNADGFIRGLEEAELPEIEPLDERYILGENTEFMADIDKFLDNDR